MCYFHQVRPYAFARRAAYLLQEIFNSTHFGRAEEARRISHSRHESQGHASLGRQLCASTVPPGIETSRAGRGSVGLALQVPAHAAASAPRPHVYGPDPEP